MELCTRVALTFRPSVLGIDPSMIASAEKYSIVLCHASDSSDAVGRDLVSWPTPVLELHACTPIVGKICDRLGSVIQVRRPHAPMLVAGGGFSV